MMSLPHIAALTLAGLVLIAAYAVLLIAVTCSLVRRLPAVDPAEDLTPPRSDPSRAPAGDESASCLT